MLKTKIRIPHKKIAEFCRLWHVTEFSLFGSVLRDDFRPDSDVDVLVEFQPGQRVGYIRLAEMEQTLSMRIGETALVTRRVSGSISKLKRLVER